jgi:hypothetical protein
MDGSRDTADRNAKGPRPFADRDPKRDRETLRMLATAVRNRWPIPEAVRSELPELAARIALNSESDRDRLRALELLAALDRDNIAALVALDRIERLDGGEATDRVDLLPIRIGVRD